MPGTSDSDQPTPDRTPPVYYKVLDADARPFHGGAGPAWELGVWQPTIQQPRCCERGYHAVTLEHLIAWLGPRIAIAQVRGAAHHAEDKSAHAAMRIVAWTAWDRQSLVAFAADCAAHVLAIYERAYPQNMRPRAAIIAARAGSPHSRADAADAAADAAAYAAADAADAAYAAAYAYAAARDAAYAARDAAYAATAAAAAYAYADADAYADAAAAADAERAWQIRRLATYLLYPAATVAPWPLPAPPKEQV